MQISKKDLNLVVPLETDAGTIYVHSAPIRPETFKQYFLILSKTLNALYAEGISQITGPRVAALMLQKLAEESDSWEGDGGVKNGLMNEIRRLTNVLLSTASGWKSLPIMEALKQGHLESRDVEEAEGFIVFFTCISHIHKRVEIPAFLAHMGKVWGVQTTLSNATEYGASLPISTEIETFSPTVSQSSLPG